MTDLVIGALLAGIAAVCYALGWVAGKATALGLWMWQALRQGYKDGL